MAERSNEQWIRALSERSSEAQGEALQDLHDFLLRVVLTYLAWQRSELDRWSQSDVHGLAEDLAQDAILEITRNLDNFRGESKFTTWAYRFVINRAVSELRRQRYRNVSLDQLREEQRAGLFQVVIIDRDKLEPEQLADQRYYLNLLRDIIDTELNERQQAEAEPQSQPAGEPPTATVPVTATATPPGGRRRREYRQEEEKNQQDGADLLHGPPSDERVT